MEVMGKIKIDVRANESPQMIRAGSKGCAVWLFGLMYASRQRPRTGFIPDTAIKDLCPLRGTRSIANKLVSLGLWDRADGGYWVRFELCAFGAERNQSTWSTACYEAVFARDGMRCRYCGDSNDMTIDHVVPRCQGGSDSADNLVVACRRCNGRKGGRTPQQAGMVLQ